MFSIIEAESIKNTLINVQDKVNRSMALLLSLSMEKDRWQHISENFKYQMTTMIDRRQARSIFSYLLPALTFISP